MSMRLLVLILIAATAATAAFAKDPKKTAAKTPTMKTFKDSVSYAVGVQVATNFTTNKVDIDPEIMFAAFRTAYTSGTLALSEEAINDVMGKFQQQMMAQQTEKTQKVGGENLKAAQAFLEENGKVPGVQTTASGLQYMVIKEGNGQKPTAESTVEVHYTGTLINGTKFDSSVDRGEPISFPLNGVIRGWTEGLQLMSVGAKYRFFIPPQLGYGEQGAGQDIGPNEALIFDVELLGIK